MTRPVAVPVRLPHPALPRADWADRYEIEVAGPLTAMQAAELAISHQPSWVRGLMWLRNRIVSMFGIKTSEHVRARAGRKIGFFPLVAATDSQVVLGFDDRHLDFRVVVDIRDNGAKAQTVTMTSLIKRNVAFGYVYLAAVTPFHRLIVQSMLAHLASARPLPDGR